MTTINGKPKIIKEINMALVRKNIIRNSPITKPELSKLLGLSLPTINKCVDELLEKEIVKVLANLEAPVKTLIVVDEICPNVARSANNIPGVKLLDAKHVNVYDILNSNKLIMTEAAIKSVEEVLG